MDEKLIDLFAGTFLDGFFQLKEEDYIEPVFERENSEIIIGKMSDAEKRVFTLNVKKYQDIASLAPIFGFDEKGLGILLETKEGDILEQIEEEAMFQYQELDTEFPWEHWEQFLLLLEHFHFLTDFLDKLIYTRLRPKNICDKPTLRVGYLITKDVFQVIEDDGSYEDEEKIASQNRFCN